jgi:hypothetical protein
MSEPEEPAPSSESASLERGYRRLLAWYPKWFRLQNTEEILAVLMACAQDDQERPSLEAAVDLLKGVIGVWLALAWGINRRRDPARIAVAAFFGLTTMSMLLALSVGSPVYSTADFAAGMVVWFISLVSTMLVFTPAANRYFRLEPTVLASPAG